MSFLDLTDIASNLLLMNAMLDCIFGVVILLSRVMGCFKSIANIYLCLFHVSEDQENPLICILSAILLFQWAWTRFFSGVTFQWNRFDGAHTYLLEAGLMMLGVMFERIDSVKGFGLTGMCVACLVLIVLADGQHSRRD